MNFIHTLLLISHYSLLITHIKIDNCPSLDSSGYPTAGWKEGPYARKAKVRGVRVDSEIKLLKKIAKLFLIKFYI
jgi:hypothetical protein